MTSRERWTIYPLLFLALGAALRGRLSKVEELRAMQCENLTIVDPAGKPVARLGTTRDKQGRIEFYNSGGKIALSAGVDPQTQAGSILVQNANGTPQVVIQSNGKTGIVETRGPAGAPEVLIASSRRGGAVRAMTGDGKLLMTFGHDDDESGVFANDLEHRQRLRVPFAGLVRQGPPLDDTKQEPQPETQPEPTKPEEPAPDSGDK